MHEHTDQALRRCGTPAPHNDNLDRLALRIRAAILEIDPAAQFAWDEHGLMIRAKGDVLASCERRNPHLAHDYRRLTTESKNYVWRTICAAPILAMVNLLEETR